VTEIDVRLEALLEAAGEPLVPLPSQLETAHGGPFRLPERVVYGNFVSSVDGIAAIAGTEMSSATISGGASADRFMMALLRAVADAVVVGAGTLREHGGPWTAEKALPAGADAFRRLRAELSAAEAPTLVVVTASGELPVDHPSLGDAVVVTTSSGARTLADREVRCADVIDVGDVEEVGGRAVIDHLRGRGFHRFLTEGGPKLMGSMLQAGAVEQLFLTISPKLVGGGSGRSPLTDEVDLLGSQRGMRLLGVRRAGDYLFLRYELAPRGG
jgi:riboflavin biosynthesis pyrimidine reductase